MGFLIYQWKVLLSVLLNILPLKLLFSTSSYNIWNCVWLKNLRSLIPHSLTEHSTENASGSRGDIKTANFPTLYCDRMSSRNQKKIVFILLNLTGMKTSSQVRTAYFSSVLGKERNLRLRGFSYSITTKTYPDHTPTIQIWVNSSSL